VYGVARESNAVDLLPYQKQVKTIPVIAKHLTKNAWQSFFGHPCLLSLNPLRESIQLLLWDICRSTQNIVAFVKSLLFSNFRVGQKKMHSFGGCPRERIQILL